MYLWGGEGSLQDARRKECSHTQPSTSASFPLLRRMSSLERKDNGGIFFTRKKSRRDTTTVWASCDGIEHADTQIPWRISRIRNLGGHVVICGITATKIHAFGESIGGQSSGDAHGPPSLPFKNPISKRGPYCVARNFVALVSDRRYPYGSTAHSVALSTSNWAFPRNWFRGFSVLVLVQECTESATRPSWTLHAHILSERVEGVLLLKPLSSWTHSSLVASWAMLQLSDVLVEKVPLIGHHSTSYQLLLVLLLQSPRHHTNPEGLSYLPCYSYP
jgi:hypothetical protein